MLLHDLDAAIRRTEAAMRALEARMQHAVGDLDYESYLHEKRALTAALLALRKRREREENFSQNSVSSDRIKDK
ncbi:hypothetical protein HMPREF1148_1225 [Selenomonas sp. FOBRC6]|uniref:V-type ATP synthase subunit D n=1 Tax=Selenomonas sp. FOBRC6 TaxID=936572 RepID=UPI000277F092|nr:V-type ATP synthase subunit D [Selenomonas sp. FOBRC6]EJO20889.1 hypothetical protein HMPREF1148_1225 [Selenomonas sp. FOBRC6]